MCVGEIQQTTVNAIKNMFSAENIVSYELFTKLTVYAPFDVCRHVDILGQPPWLDIINVYF